MKIISFALLVFFTQMAIGQDCKFKVDKVDPITGKKKQIIKLKTLFFDVIGYYKIDDDMGIEVVAMETGTDGNSISPKGSPMELKLGNDSVLNLNSVEDAKPIVNISHTTNSSNVSETFTIKYSVSAGQAKQIIASGIAYARAHIVANRVVNISFKKDEIESSKVKAKCIFQ